MIDLSRFTQDPTIDPEARALAQAIEQGSCTNTDLLAVLLAGDEGVNLG